MDKVPRYLNAEGATTCARQLKDWWASLDDRRGERARLRRVETPQEALLTDGFFRFLRPLPDVWKEEENLLTAALVATILAHVKANDDSKSFAQQLATPHEGGSHACMSELRFQQLQKSRDPEEFYRRLLRAVRLRRGSVNIVSLAQDILDWMREYQQGADRHPAKRLAIRWAKDYYLELEKATKTAVSTD